MRPERPVLAMTVALLFLAGCLDAADPSATGDDLDGPVAAAPPNQSHPAYGFPVYLPENGTLAGGWPLPAARPVPDPIRGLAEVAHVEGTSTGGGIAVFGHWAYIGDRTQGPLEVIDISDPTRPTLVGRAADVPVRDADTIAYPDGRLVVITTAGSITQYVTDVTDPANPQRIADIQTPHGNHNLAVVPGTPIVYNSGSGGTIDIVDYSDPFMPELVGEFTNGNNCHDTTFYINAAEGKFRAYCAAYPNTQIWDITDPLNPEIIARIPYPTMEQGIPVVGDALPRTSAFPLSFSHLAMVNHDATVLIVGDETGGGAINGCDVYAEVGGDAVSGPLGNLWFYDLTDERNPQLRGHVSPGFVDAVGGSCTAHFGRLVEDTGFLVMGYYAAGVALVDFRDIDNPLIVDRWDPPTAMASVWDVWYYQGYLFTGDMNRGMDVLALR